MAEEKSKRKILHDKVVNLVKEFIETEGGITARDLEDLFGCQEVNITLSQIPFRYVSNE